MSVVRRCSAGAVVAGLVLLGSPAWAQEDPCAGSRPVEPGDGVVTDGGSGEGIAEGEPAPGTDAGGAEQPVEEPAAEPKPEPVEEPAGEEPAEPSEPTLGGDTPVDSGGGSGAAGEDGVVCAYAAPVSAPVESAPVGAVAPDTAAGTATPEGAAALPARLPRTGPYDRVLALAAAGTGLVLAGAGVASAGRRRLPQV